MAPQKILGGIVLQLFTEVINSMVQFSINFPSFCVLLFHPYSSYLGSFPKLDFTHSSLYLSSFCGETWAKTITFVSVFTEEFHILTVASGT